MSFWIKVDVCEKGLVEVTTFDLGVSGYPKTAIRKRTATTVSQALRKLAADMVTVTKKKEGER